MKHVTEVRLFPNDDAPIKSRDLPFLFISKLTSLDSRITWKENLNIDGSPRDFIYAMLHCSDDHLRQRIMEKFASCQLALTVLLPGVKKDAQPQLLVWALRRIVKKWKENETSVAPEKRMVSEPIFTAAFIRFGDISMSKSSVLNSVLGRAQGNEPFRYFLSYEEEKEYVFHVCGSVEAQWYLPMYGRKEELFREVTLLLNLRGNANEFITESKFMCRVANAVFIFLSKDEIEHYKTAIGNIKKQLKNVFVIYLCEKQGKRVRQKRRRINDNETKPKTYDSEQYVEFEVERSETELANIICRKIIHYCNDTDVAVAYHAIEDWHKICSNDINIGVDQDNSSYKTANMLLEASFPIKESINDMKRSYLQLQKEWVEWVKADKQPYCIGTESVDMQYVAKSSKKLQLRRQQRRKGLSPKMNVFLNNLRQVLYDETSDHLYYFMTLFQTHIENMASIEIPPLVKKIEELNASLQGKRNELKDASSADERRQLQNEMQMLEEMLIEQSEQFSVKNISCEHFIRELGHLYEATFHAKNTKDQNQKKMLIDMAAKLLREGYPLEILDGENAYIPIKWISGVLQSLKTSLNNPKIYVLSIIGIQSSGKSTLLNSMFGVSFPVRAGKCTRGVYLQLLKINDDFQKDFGFQYLLIIDTEGLKSPDRTVQNDYTFDNLIATFAMCIGDLTLLNIGQETIGPDMIGILQIVVHALIRMKKVQLVSNCRIIQQRVSDVAAAANNKSNMAKIKDALNKATRTAAAEEKVDNIRDFADVFPLVEDDDLQFFPSLWMGLMSPPNSGYSDKVHALKADIFTSKRSQGQIPPQFTMDKFISRLKDVWEAVKTEDFVFHFQNSFDALSNQRFRLHHNILIGKMRTEITDWELKESKNLSTATIEKMCIKMDTEIEINCKAVNEKIDEYVIAHSHEDEVKRRQQSIKNETFDIGKNIARAIRMSSGIRLKNNEDIKGMPKFITEAKDELKRAAKEAALGLRNTQPSSTDWKENRVDLENNFEKLWIRKTKTIEEKYSKTKIVAKTIDDACEKCLSFLILKTEYSKTYSEVIKKGLKKIWPFNTWGSRGGKQEGRSEFNEILMSHISDLKKLAHVRPFQQHHVDTILTSVYNHLKERKVGNENLVSFLLEARDTIAEVCKQYQAEYEEKHSLQQMFEKEKQFMFKEFLGFFDETIKTEAAVERSYSELKTAIQDHIVDYFNVILLTEMRNENCYNDKEKMIGAILLELYHKKPDERAHSYYQFINKFDTFVDEWLRQKVRTKITSSHDSFSGVLKTKINTMLKIIEMTIAETATVFQKEDKYIQTTFLTWADVFLDNENIKMFGLNLEFSVEDFKLSDIHGFTDAMRTIFHQYLEADIISSLGVNSLHNEKDANYICSKMKKNVAIEILEHLGVCHACCPFCGVNCHRQITGDHIHKAAIHYSQGVAGFIDVSTGMLTKEPCTLLIASDIKYWRGDGPLKKYKDYKTDHPSWDITPVQGDKPIDYWKWVLQSCNDDFATIYETKPAEFLEDWQRVTDDEALASLKEHYKLE